MTRTRLPLERCANGCDAPPKPPSKVLCAECFAKLDAKMNALAEAFGIKLDDFGPEGGSDE